MNYIVIIQARMGSNRLPGKSFYKINNRSLIDYLVESILHVTTKDKIFIATSENIENDILREYASEKGLTCYSGDEENVASRFKNILEAHPEVDYFFRICGDSPYYDGELLQNAVRKIEDNDLDILTSMSNKGYPMGCNVELLKKSMFLQNYSNFEIESHFEHVTGYFYENINSFKFEEINCGIDNYNYSDYKFSVDTKDDLELAKLMLFEMKYEPWNYSFNQKIEIQKKIKN